MPDLTNEELTLALAVVAGVALLSFLLLVWFAFRLRRIRREYMVLRGDGPERDILGAVGRIMKQVKALDHRVDGVVTANELQAANARNALQKFYMVRYDAFDDMGGRLSFSAALLDDFGDGIVITSINGRTETRTYAKEVKALSSEYNLSDEEREAIAGAAASHRRGEAKAAATR